MQLGVPLGKVMRGADWGWRTAFEGILNAHVPNEDGQYAEVGSRGLIHVTQLLPLLSASYSRQNAPSTIAPHHLMSTVESFLHFADATYKAMGWFHPVIFRAEAFVEPRTVLNANQQPNLLLNPDEIALSCPDSYVPLISTELRSQDILTASDNLLLDVARSLFSAFGYKGDPSDWIREGK